MRRRFVCVFNRARDNYQVPVALHEAGLLDTFVTDYYAPESSPAWLPRFLRSKRHLDLPSKSTHSDRIAFLVQYAAQAFRIPMQKIWGWIDPRLGRTAGRLAARHNADLYCYHTYLPQDVPDDACLIVFVFHPLHESYLPLLADDLKLFPEVARSHEMELQAQFDAPLTVPWSRPDAIVCASSVTARSVIAAGAPPERIAVIPYGLPDSPGGPLDVRTEGSDARFLYVGNGIQRKGIHHLLRAWCSQPRGNSELIVVSYDLDPEIAKIAKDDKSVKLMGYQTKDKLDELFAKSDVFIMPSLLEGFGLVYLEALAAGCHVIATPNTGVPDLGLSADAATLVPAGDLSAISSAIEAAVQRAMRGEFNRAAIAAEGRRWRQIEFRRAIGEHAAGVLRWHSGEGLYPEQHLYRAA